MTKNLGESAMILFSVSISKYCRIKIYDSVLPLQFTFINQANNIISVGKIKTIPKESLAII